MQHTSLIWHHLPRMAFLLIFCFWFKQIPNLHNLANIKTLCFSTGLRTKCLWVDTFVWCYINHVLPVWYVESFCLNCLKWMPTTIWRCCAMAIFSIIRRCKDRLLKQTKSPKHYSKLKYLTTNQFNHILIMCFMKQSSISGLKRLLTSRIPEFSPSCDPEIEVSFGWRTQMKQAVQPTISCFYLTDCIALERIFNFTWNALHRDTKRQLCVTHQPSVKQPKPNNYARTKTTEQSVPPGWLPSGCWESTSQCVPCAMTSGNRSATAPAQLVTSLSLN